MVRVRRIHMRVVMLWQSRGPWWEGGDMWCCPSVFEHGRVVFGIGGGHVSILEFLKLGV